MNYGYDQQQKNKEKKGYKRKFRNKATLILKLSKLCNPSVCSIALKKDKENGEKNMKKTNCIAFNVYATEKKKKTKKKNTSS